MGELRTNVAEGGNVRELWEIETDIGSDTTKHLESVPRPCAHIFDGVFAFNLERCGDFGDGVYRRKTVLYVFEI
jgi:hypothetical protein